VAADGRPPHRRRAAVGQASRASAAAAATRAQPHQHCPGHQFRDRSSRDRHRVPLLPATPLPINRTIRGSATAHSFASRAQGPPRWWRQDRSEGCTPTGRAFIGESLHRVVTVLDRGRPQRTVTHLQAVGRTPPPRHPTSRHPAEALTRPSGRGSVLAAYIGRDPVGPLAASPGEYRRL
jgi:hypothetical protein